MKRLIFAFTLVAVGASAFAADVGVSVQVGEPGLYGRVEIGTFPQPRVVYREPVVIQTAPVYALREPIYLHVRPGHEKNWRKHCREYNACGQPVYFVQDTWYNDVYLPRYRDRHEGGRDEDRRDNGREQGDDDHGREHGHGHGNGHKHD